MFIMPVSLDILLNVLELEKSKNFNNSSVSGGLKNFISFLEKPEISSSFGQDTLDQISHFFLIYESLDYQQRQETILKILQWLGDSSSMSLEIPNKDFFPSKKTGDLNNSLKEDGKTGRGLFADIKSLKGIGVKNSRIFQKLGILKIIDLLRYFPRRYQDFSTLKPIDQIEFGEELTIIGSISQDVFIRESRSGKLKIIETAISDGTGTLKLNWFNKPFLRNQLRKGMPVVVSGKVDIYLGRLVMTSPEWEPLDREQLHTNRIVPIYPLTAGITQRQLRNIIGHNIKIWNKKLGEYFEPSILDTENLLGIEEAISQIHFPDSNSLLSSAKKRFAFEEIFFLQLGVLIQKRNWVDTTARKFSISDKQLFKVADSLPYTLTKSQTNVVAEILEDLVSGKPMNRLLQGDVGSGKTVVARYAIECILSNQAQTAVMAPTSILAEQHYKTLSDLLLSSNSLEESEIALLIGDTPGKDRAEILTGLLSGKIRVIIGTHALLEEPVVFKDLQLAVIDEQHRFGVHQRKTLRDKGDSPHLLVMTATPIPRSLALTVHGDLDVSVIDEMPAGRKPVETLLLHPDERGRAYDLIKEEVGKGFQAFIIYPMVEIEDEGEDFTAAVNEHKRLSNSVFPNINVGLIHGKLPAVEKDKIMNNFRKGEFDILVSTTVIEVGVDIPNATLVLIEGANHFGLAQLHQIRGRVGRNSENSVCILIPENEDGLENDRLSAMVRSNDGFELADIDLKLRGPGEFLGTRQSGYSNMKFANFTDIESIERCRILVKEIFEDDPQLKKNENLNLKEELKYRWPELNLT